MLGLLIAIGITVLLAHRLGATAQADAYVMARRLVAGMTEVMHRAMLLLFIPILARDLFSDGAPRRAGLARWSWRLLLVGAVLVAVLWAAAPVVVGALAPGLPADTHALAVLATRLMLLSIPAVMLANLYTAGLYLRGVYGLPALFKQMPRLAVLLVFAFAGAACLVETASAAFALGSYLLLAGCAVLMLRTGKADGNAAAKRPRGEAVAAAGLGVALLMVAGPQAVSWMEVYFAVKLGDGALTVLELSQRIATLIAAIFIVSTTMPHLAEWARSPEARTPASFGRAFVIGAFFLVCVQGYFMLNAREVVGVLYSQSQLSAETLDQMASMVALITVSPLMTFVYQIMAVWNIASGRRGLVWVILLAVAVNLAARAGLAIGLMPDLGLHALALGKLLGPALAALAVIAFGDRSWWPRRAPSGAGLRVLLTAALTLAGMAAGQQIARLAMPEAGVMSAAALSLILSALAGAGALALGAWRLRLLTVLRNKDITP